MTTTQDLNPWFDDEVQIVAQLVPTIEGRA
jgi:hypothetical protein